MRKLGMDARRPPGPPPLPALGAGSNGTTATTVGAPNWAVPWGGRCREPRRARNKVGLPLPQSASVLGSLPSLPSQALRETEGHCACLPMRVPVHGPPSHSLTLDACQCACLCMAHPLTLSHLTLGAERRQRAARKEGAPPCPAPQHCVGH